MGDDGLEPESGSGLLSNDLRQSPNQFGTETGTVGGETGTVDPDLRAVVTAWPGLAESAREAVLRIVAEARQGGEVGSP